MIKDSGLVEETSITFDMCMIQHLKGAYKEGLLTFPPMEKICKWWNGSADNQTEALILDIF